MSQTQSHLQISLRQLVDEYPWLSRALEHLRLDSTSANTRLWEACTERELDPRTVVIMLELIQKCFITPKPRPCDCGNKCGR